MKSSAIRLAFAIGLVLARRAWAENTLYTQLDGASVVPGPGMAAGSVSAVVVVDGTTVSLTIALNGLSGWMAPHIHRGGAGIAGRLVVEFPGNVAPTNVPSAMFFASASSKVAADLVANPQKYYVDVHTTRFPTGAARGQLTARPGSSPAPASGIPRFAIETQPPDQTPQSPTSHKADQSITFRPLPSLVYLDPDFSVRASATSRLEVTFTASGDCSMSGSTVHLLSAGKCWVTAHQPGDSNFNAAPDVDQRFTIEKARQKIRGAAPAQKTYLDPDFPLEITGTSGIPVIFIASGNCEVKESYVHILGAGSCSLTAHQPGDPNFTAASIVDWQFTILKADQTISFADLPNSYYGSGELLLNAQASSGLPVRFTAAGTCTLTGSLLYIAGEGACTVIAEQPGNENFNAAPPVTQTIAISGP